MRAHWLVLSACTLVLLLGADHADAQGMDTQRFVPAAGAAGGFMLERPVVPPHLGFGAGLFLNYADDALVLKSRSGDDLARVVDNALALDLLGSIGLFDHIEIALHLPIALWYDGDPSAAGGVPLEAGGGLGDLRLVPKGVFYRTSGRTFGLALGAALPITFPTGDSEALRGADALTFEPRFLFGLLGDRWNLLSSLGFRLRTSTGDNDLVGHEITFGLGGTVSVIPRRDLLDILVEVVGSGDLAKDKPEATGAPLELLGGAVVKPHPCWHVYAGFGAGLIEGLGTPDFRILVGLRFSHRRAEAFKDSDNDGIADRNDRCPTNREDFDGFEDEDGCPDMDGDSDNDGIPDSKDRCPSEPEDKDGFEDTDGCPEKDNDKDGILDNDDECPEAPEEPGGDRDGCPEKGHVIVKDGKIVVLGKVQFETGSDRIQKKSDPLLDEMATVLKTHPELGTVRIEGHTDDVGEEDFNQKLSEKRAESVRKALVQRGVPAARLTTRGYGESKPIAPNTTPAGRAKNRRVEFVRE